MTFASEKRKNDEPRRFTWWMLLVAFALGVIITLLVIVLLTQPVGRVEVSVTQALEAQSAQAFETPIPPDMLTVTPAAPLNTIPELNLTATSIVVGATQTAQAARPSR